MENSEIINHNNKSNEIDESKKKDENVDNNSQIQSKTNSSSSKKPFPSGNIKVLSKSKSNDNNSNNEKQKTVTTNSTNIRSYSSVVGNNSNDSNRIVIKAPITSNENSYLDKKQDQEDVIEEIDPFILERLEDDNDRMFILRLEYEMTNLLKNKKDSIEYPNMNSYQRLIIHKIANYFKLCHINDRNNSSVIVIKTMASRIPKRQFIDIIAKPDDINPSEAGNSEIKIMKRNDKNSNEIENNKKVADTKKKQSESDLKKTNISLEERKLAYDLARARIFDESNQTSNNNSKINHQKENKQNIIKRVDVEEDDDKDVYNRSNFVIKQQITPDFNNFQYFNQSPNLISQTKFQQSPYQKKFTKPMTNPKMNINPQMQQNPFMRQTPLMHQQIQPNNMINNNNLSYTPILNNNNGNSNNNNNNSRSYSNMRNYSNFNTYNINNSGNFSNNDNSLLSNTTK